MRAVGLMTMLSLSATLILLSSAGCGSSTVAAVAESEGSPVEPAKKVTAGRPTVKTLERRTTQPGRIEAFEEAPLYAKVSGYTEKVLVDIGDRVEKGQTLIRLSVPELVDDRAQKDALVAQAEAEVEQAKSIVEASRAAVETSKARILEAEAGVGRAAGELERCKSEHARVKELAADGSVSKKLEDESLNQLRSAEAARNEAAAKTASASAALNESQANVRKSQADEVAAAARLRVAQADLARTQTMLNYTEIKAPFAGVVTRRSVDTGHYVSPAHGGDGKPLLVVASLDQVRVFVDVPELEAPFVDAGDAADIEVQALESLHFEGNVVRTSWSLMEANRSLRTEIDIPNPQGALRPGMYARVIIRLDRRENALTVPVAAVVRNGQSAHCCCVVSDRIEVRPVELGLRNGDEIEIVSGLAPDDLVVFAQADSLAPGQAVVAAQAE